MARVFKLLIRFYQLVISPIAPGNCRYYPSCSHYALAQFDNRNPAVALIVSLGRILRCNQLFEGGFDYPVKRFKKSVLPLAPVNSRIGPIRYFLLPKDHCHVYIIPVLKEKR
jgi:putative membrane protein insertion efficiency factor